MTERQVTEVTRIGCQAALRGNHNAGIPRQFPSLVKRKRKFEIEACSINRRRSMVWAPIDCCDSPKADNQRRGHMLVRLSMSSDPTGSDLWLSAQIVEHQ